MSQQRNANPFLIQCGVGALLAVVLGVVALGFEPEKGNFRFAGFTGLVKASYNLPFLFRRIVKPTEAVIVYMDEDAHRELGQPNDASWDRGLHARLVERLTAEGARAVVFDIVFTDPNRRHPEGDERFARAIAANRRVILGEDFGFTPEGAPTAYAANVMFREGAVSGITSLRNEQDFIVWRHLHVPPHPDADNFSSMAWETAQLLGVAEAQNPTNRARGRWMNYYGPPGTIPSVSFHRALETNAAVPAEFFSNQVVFVGANTKTKFSGERKDELRTPYTSGFQFVAAVDVQATQFLNLLRGDWLTRMTQAAELTLIVLCGLVLGIGLALLRPLTATGVALLVAAAIAFVAWLVFVEQRMWFPWTVIVAAQLPAALLWSVLYNSFRSFIQNKLLAQSLGLYLSPKQVQRMLKDPDSLKPGGGKATVSILFSDIAGFSRISEQLDATALVQLLNSYYEQTIRCIHQTEGTVVDIIGDAIFAIWNAPEPQPDHQQRMLRAALLFQKNVSDFNTSAGKFALRTRVGLHTGEVVVGNVGSSEHFDFTAIGDNVNLSSRLEGLNKHLGTTVLLTRDALAGVDVGEFILRPAGNFRFKGLDKLVEVHELVITSSTREQEQPWLTAYAEAMEKFRACDFDAAEKLFQRVLELRAEDGLANFYLKEVAHWRATPPPEGWAGEVEMKEK
ncbi:MAG: adenylate/guanylate cyclase domain-containing protein [Verrucomicrobia bacterium]|nr:adenylate/guanylate cyclase domain-containing protein [Verrucomicrobiota bacterium]